MHPDLDYEKLKELQSKEESKPVIVEISDWMGI